MRTSQLQISAATFACLLAADIHSISDFNRYPCDALLDSPHFGPLEIDEVVRELNKHGITLPPLPGRPERGSSTPRYEVFRLRLIDGLTYAAIGERVGLTQERVRQILHAHYGLKHRPPAVDARQRREAIERRY